MEIIERLANIADDLDAQGSYQEADEVTVVMQGLADRQRSAKRSLKAEPRKPSKDASCNCDEATGGTASWWCPKHGRMNRKPDTEITTDHPAIHDPRLPERLTSAIPKCRLC